ncbi:hypothetical protein IV203_012426 [Nitzschia inconspicua]|uniref:Uncharacterized protein n=1 Tax=Nitzschia inconspicua TaxID=303405 RepID=A0A9K3PLX7_9STRA|nr:hypothetical protein IV203_012426 [Nitzschia inconspicua]
MDVLPVLTPRFLEDYPSKEEQLGLTIFPTPRYLEDSPAKFVEDNTHKYLTQRWLSLTTPNHPNGFGRTNTNDDTLSPSFSYKDDAVPMWISPTTSFQTTQVESLALTVNLQNLPAIPSTSLPHTFDSNDKKDIPSVIFIRTKRWVGETNFSFLPLTECPVYIEEEDDVVSALADNPDEDDVGVLPHATYDVLANIFDEIYKDDIKVNEEDNQDDDSAEIPSQK